MVRCHICLETILTSTDLKTHYQYHHPTVTKYTCVGYDCYRSYGNLVSFIKHVHNKHDSEQVGNVQVSNTPIVPVSSTSSVETEFLEERTTSIQPTALIHEFNLARKEVYEKFTLDLYSNASVPETKLRKIVLDVSHLCGSTFLNSLKQLINQVFSQNGVDSKASVILTDIFNQLEEPFSNVKSQYKTEQNFQQTNFYNDPKSYTIGSKLVKKKVNKKYRRSIVHVCGQYISLKNNLKMFLELPNAFEIIQSYIKNLDDNDDYVKNIMQCSLWKKKMKRFENNEIVLPLYIYYDDFEPNNSVGAHSGKLGAVYALLACLPPECQSTLKNIFLVQLFNTKDKAIYGNKAAFRPLINELNMLEKVGIKIQTNSGENIQVYFMVVLFLGDNLGLHGILGFTEGFRNKFACRFCKTPMEIKNTQYLEDATALRSYETYEDDLKLGDARLTGVKSECVFNNINSFHVADNFAVDVMHDLLEGVCHYDLIFLLNYYIFECKFFSLEILNERLISYNYQSGEKKNLPEKIKVEHLNNNKLKMTAQEMFSFVRFFGLLIGDFIPEENTHWNLYILLREILNITMSRILSKNTHESLEVLVEEHSALYVKLTKTNLKPKMHHLIHYARILKMSGPFILYSSTRFESKHQEVKRGTKSFNRINLPKTAAKRHQLSMMQRFKNRESILPQISTSGSVHMKFTDCDNYIKFKYYLPTNIDVNNRFHFVKSINFKGTEYKLESIIVLGIDDKCLPIFGRIKEIVFLSNTASLIGTLLSTEYFNNHLYAYAVSESDKWFYTCINALYDPMVLNMHTFSDGDSYIVTKHVL